MSGICGIVCLDAAAAVNSELLQSMTASMAFRGPDAQQTWLGESVGFGYTLLRTTFATEREHQPASLDGQVWITADARIDGQRELISKLRLDGQSVPDDVTDCELILLAYKAWGDACVKHLIGDFAFAIWDSTLKRLFCARDHFGIKPFFYASTEHELIFSNTLNCVRHHPNVPSTLDDLFIADFLLFGDSQRAAATAFADIHRLPAAHTLTWAAGKGVQLERYWTLPTDLGVRQRPAGDYVEHFKKLFEQAVGDRMRSDRVGIEMSGGLDSASIAATAHQILLRRAKPFSMHAQTNVFDTVIPDDERYYSGLVAKHLKIHQQFFVVDQYPFFEPAASPAIPYPEPTVVNQPALLADWSKAACTVSRVFLTGWDGDALLSESLRPHFKRLVQKRQYLQLLSSVLRYIISQRQLVPSGWRRWLQSCLSSGDQTPFVPVYPRGLSQELEARFDLRRRWTENKSFANSKHPSRPYAYTIYAYLMENSQTFENYDAGHTGYALQYQHPLMDLRLLDYCLSLPHQPWVVKKHVLREAMRGLLPELVRKRPKSPLAKEPTPEMLRRVKLETVECIESKNLYHYLDSNTINTLSQYPEDPQQVEFWLRAKGLANWLGQ